MDGLEEERTKENRLHANTHTYIHAIHSASSWSQFLLVDDEVRGDSANAIHFLVYKSGTYLGLLLHCVSRSSTYMHN